MKKLQVLRVDNDLVEKVDLQIGPNIIGRNVVTGCDDDRVITHAVTINLTSDNEMTITPYQVTPCYIKSIESSRWQLIKLGTTVPIKSGDICSLVPDKCWFKIISVPNKVENNEEYILKRKANEDTDSDVHDKRLRLESGEGDNLRSSCNTLNKMVNNSNNLSKENIMNEDNSLHDKDDDKMQNSNCKLIRAPRNANELSVMKREDYKLKNGNETSSKVLTSEKGSSPRANSDSPPVSQDNVNTATKDTYPCIKTKTDESEMFTSTTSNVFRGEKCKYGEKCYRKNPEHKAKFSHPGDSDYDVPDNRKECPYGIRCYRKNSQHRIRFKHTDKNMTNKHNKRSCKQTKTQESLDTLSEMEDLSAEESVDESEYEPSSHTESSDDSVDEYYDKSENE